MQKDNYQLLYSDCSHGHLPVRTALTKDVMIMNCDKCQIKCFEISAQRLLETDNETTEASAAFILIILCFICLLQVP